MKEYINVFLTTLILMITVSCTTVEKITVYGKPGEKIYSPLKQHVATIQQNGNTQIKLASDAYYGYMYTYDAMLGQWVPFALNVKKKSHTGTKLATGTGYTLTGLGLGLFLGGTTAVIIDNESEVAGTLMGAGIALGGIGASFGIPASKRMGQLAYQYNLGYTSRQQTNSDIRLSAYVVPKEDDVENQGTRKKTTSGEMVAGTDSSSAKIRKGTATSTAKKKRKTLTEQITGEYTGNGTLTTSGEDAETLGTIVVIITPKDEDTVLAEILEDNEAFFESEELFKVTKNKDSSFTLTHTRIPSVKFTINKAGKIDYKHPKVNIDGTTYTLSVTARKNEK